MQSYGGVSLYFDLIFLLLQCIYLLTDLMNQVLYDKSDLGN